MLNDKLVNGPSRKKKNCPARPKATYKTHTEQGYIVQISSGAGFYHTEPDQLLDCIEEPDMLLFPNTKIRNVVGVGEFLVNLEF